MKHLSPMHLNIIETNYDGSRGIHSKLIEELSDIYLCVIMQWSNETWKAKEFAIITA